MLIKRALEDIVPLQIFTNENGDPSVGMIRTASNRLLLEPGSKKSQIVEAEIKKHPNALFFRAKAIEANKANTNGDYFSEEELLKSYMTFVDVPFFTNHDNQNVENAKGKQIFAEWVPEEKAVYTISYVDRDAYPHIARSIEEGYVTGVSMGCSVEYSVCNICHNRAEKTDDYCSHIRNRKGRKFSGKAKNVKTGEIKDFKDELVFEYNYGIKFIELSAVVDPACPTCHIQGVIKNDDYLKQVANMQNNLFMIKAAAIEKQAGKEEVTQIEGVLDTLEAMAVSLIKQRKQVEPEFASDLVQIITDLQKWIDELVAAGYGNLPSGGVPGTEGNAPAEAPAAPMPSPPQQGQAMDVASEQPIAGGQAGQVSGSPSKPLVNNPTLPISAPLRPKADENKLIQKISDVGLEIRQKFGYDLVKKIANVAAKMNKIGDDDMAKRRTLAAKMEDKEKAMEVLSSSWQEKQEFFEYIKGVPSIQDNDNKLAVKKKDDTFLIVAETKDAPVASMVWTYEDLSYEQKEMIKQSPKDAAIELLESFANSINQKKEGVNNMTDNNRAAGASSVNKNTEVITERQLDEKGLYHSRTGVEQDQITQKQLDSVRKNTEADVVTQKQLDSLRTNTEADVVTQKQLDSKDGAMPRTGVEADQVTQKQLDSQRTGTEQDQITERQLDSVDSPWARLAKRDSSKFKTASAHMDAVVDVVADTVLASGCTPDEVCEVASSMVASTEQRVKLAKSILTDSKSEDVDFAKRVAYWAGKHFKIATAGKAAIADVLVEGLRKVASDVTTNPEVLISAVDVISEGGSAIPSIVNKIDEKLAAAAATTSKKSSVKDELRQALAASSGKDSREKERLDLLASITNPSKQQRESERQGWTKKLASKADTMIETSFAELGSKKDDPSFKKNIVSFARGALASNNMRLASITNVTISGDTIQIAVQTDDGSQSVEIPIGQSNGPENAELPPEGDMSGEGLENSLNPNADITASSKKVTKVAQTPSGGGIPQTPGGNGGGAPEGALPGAAPMTDPVQALTTGDEPVDSPADEIPSTSEKQMPWSICPECGSSDVDITQEEDGGVTGQCNNPDCGCKYEALIKKEVEFKLVKPAKGKGEVGAPEGGAPAPEAPAMPEVPALPVAAQTRLDKKSIVRIASNKQKYGHVCPACGTHKCKASVESNGHTEYSCDKCGTTTTKDVLVSQSSPDKSVLRVSWDISPDVVGCPSCKEKAQKLASRVKVAGMLKKAAKEADSFPMANCVERIGRKYGGNTVASFGDCKGKLLADCVCSELKKLGFRTVRHMERLASAALEVDPMETCIEEQKKKGHDLKQAASICGCVKSKVVASLKEKDPIMAEAIDNMYLAAFIDDIKSGKEKTITANDLVALKEIYAEQAKEVVAQQELAKDKELDIDIGSELPKQTESKETKTAMNSMKITRINESPVKVAGTPKQIETIEGNVEAGVPRSEQYLGKEKAADSMINQTPAKPNVPRGNAYMGKEKDADSMINKELSLPDVAQDSSYLGHEKEVQSGMPAINNEIKGTVIAESDTVVKEAKKLKEVDSVDGNVDVPRGKATMGKEGPDNIDVKENKPDVPRGDAKMGNESAENIDVKADAPDVPTGDAYMGKEKETQKGMPANNEEILKNVQQKRDVQLGRIAAARETEAIKTTAWLASSGRIASDKETFDAVVKALASFELGQITKVAEQMFPAKQVKTASSTTQEVKEAGHSIPAMILESKATQDDLASRLGRQFTIGNRNFDEKLTVYGEK